MKYLVTLYPDTTNAHLSQIYAGLNQLHADRQIRLRHQRPDYGIQRAFTSVTLWLDVTDLGTGVTRGLCYDLTDAGVMESEDGLRKCDVLFKRSFDPALVATFDPRLAAKIRPYGLNVPSRSDRLGLVLQQLLFYYLSPGNIGTYQNRRTRFDPIPVLRQVSSAVSGRLPAFASRAVSDWSVGLLEKPALGPEVKRVLFQTGLYDPDLMPVRTKALVEATVRINEYRVRVVRALKRAFGERFIGGLVPDAYARRYFGDCLTTLDTRRQVYMDSMKASRVVVSSKGLHNSNPWKLAEYLAAGRCIVTEPLAYELPDPLVDGTHVVLYDSVERCVEACGRMLENDGLAREMQQQAVDYYRQFVRPSALMMNTLNEAFRQD